MEDSFEEFLRKDANNNWNTRSEDVARNIPSKFHKKKRKKKTITYNSSGEFDFMKFYIIVEYYFLKVVFKDISPKEFKMLLFLYSEPPFTRQDFDDYTEMLCWNKKRLNEFVNKGFVQRYEIKNPRRKGVSKSKLYTLTKGTKRQIRAFYDKLMLRYKIPEHKTHNPLFREASRSYTDKRYAKKIKQMNEGKYNESKTEDDYDDLNDLKFEDFVEDWNKSNHETIETIKDIKEKTLR